MRKLMVAGNWKMNGSKSSISSLLGKIKSDMISEVDWVVFPPFPYIAYVQGLLADSDVAWGAQNVNEHVEGAYTGEVSLGMLQDLGCRYVIIGHSERRHIYGEDDLLLASKFSVAYEAGVTPVFCVGETLAEREAGQTEQVVSRQLDAILAQEGDVERLRKAVIAYEPVWAIGTGKTASPEQAQEVHQMIRQRIAGLNPGIAEHLRILYGGSVKGSNAGTLFAMPDIDGGLVGGASLNADDFLEIGRSCNN